MQGDIEVRECLEADAAGAFLAAAEGILPPSTISPGEEDLAITAPKSTKENIETLHERRFDPVKVPSFLPGGTGRISALRSVWSTPRRTASSST